MTFESRDLHRARETAPCGRIWNVPCVARLRSEKLKEEKWQR
jgi:hypothetical protein